MSYAATFDHDPAWNESLKGPLVRSALLHIAIIGGFSAYAWWLGGTEKFGAKDAGGAAVGIEVVKSIPLVTTGETNPVANDTKSIVPPKLEEKKAPKAQPDKDPDGIAIEKAKAKKPPPPATQKTLRPFDEVTPNQLTSKQLPAMSSPMFAPVAGSGQIGLAGNTTLGTRFPAYAGQIRQLVQQNWRTADVDPSLKTAPRVTAVFTLMRDGTARNIHLTQKSGFPTLDFSVERAIQAASPFPRIPAEFEKDSIEVEFAFELRR